MAAPAPRKINIAIIGGGIGGLALVLAIQHFCDLDQLEVNVYESAAQISQIGAGINVWERVYDILTELGMEAEFATHLREGETSFTCRKSDQPEGVTFREVSLDQSGKMLLMHRADVQDIFLKYISPDIKMHLSHRLESYSYNDCATQRIDLKFRGGQKAQCDLLIAADGVHSAVRQVFLPRLAKKLGKPELLESLEPIFSGSRVFRGLVPAEELSKVWPNHPALTKPHQYCGLDKHIVTYPVSRGRFVNVVPFYTDYSKEDTPFTGSYIGSATNEELLQVYDGWESEVMTLLKCIPTPSHWSVLTMKPFDIWADEGVMLLGDAAHAMTPHLGAGAGQAIEDAYILARVLGHAQKKGSREMLSDETMKLYNCLRPPVANLVQARAKLQTRFYEFREEDVDLSLVEADSSLHKESDRLAKLGAGIWDGFHWSNHSVVRQNDADVADLLS
ncbi:FAD/NAD(P)-binding domain-containing protein [Schizophyllum commune Tattone D]|nr:FAD/NAD(P)-binding domain-containing protein [Schizophyllum commune Tattone D]